MINLKVSGQKATLSSMNKLYEMAGIEIMKGEI